MKQFLLKRFIPDWQKLEKPEVRAYHGMACTLTDMLVLFFSGVAKLSIGTVIHSVSLTTSGVSALIDMILNVVTLVGFRISIRKDNDKHPFGYARAEYVTGIIMAFVIFVIGLELIMHAIEDIQHPKEINQLGMITLGVLSLDIVGSFYRRHICEKTAHLINSIPMRIAAEKATHDIFTTLMIIGTLLLNRYAEVNIDGYVGLFIASTVLYTSYKCGRNAISPLLGRIPSPELTEEIQAKILAYPNVKGIHELIIHMYGEHRCFISAHVEFPDSMLKEEIVQEVCDIEQDFLFERRYLVLHVDLVSFEDPICNSCKEIVDNYLRHLDPDAYISDLRRVESKTEDFLFFTLHTSHALLKEHPDIRNEVFSFVQENLKGATPVIVVKTLYV
ncbi:cation diffusion facilitator family transporter [Parabacteroides sp.]